MPPSACGMRPVKREIDERAWRQASRRQGWLQSPADGFKAGQASIKPARGSVSASGAPPRMRRVCPGARRFQGGAFRRGVTTRTSVRLIGEEALKLANLRLRRGALGRIISITRDGFFPMAIASGFSPRRNGGSWSGEGSRMTR